MARIRVGTSGWSYPHWRGDFYPQGLPQRAELAYNVEHFDTVELNGSFYSLQRPSSYRAWAEQAGGVRDDVVFTVKGSRYVTHMKRLRDVQTALANFFASGVFALGRHMGPFLWQLPERQAFDADVLEAFFALLPRTTSEAAALAAHHDDRISGDRVLLDVEVDLPLRHALEPRHRSFEDPAAVALSERHGIATVIADTGGRFAFVDAVTSDFVYARLHGPEGLYDSSYSPEQLDAWAARFRGYRDAGLGVYVYFDNDGHCRAPYDAAGLRGRV